jgi:HD-like signal output (HDOD) protein
MCDTFLSSMPITEADILRAATSLGVIAGGANTAHRIMATLCDASLDASQIAEVIQREPALAARVLKVANSAFYGSSRNIGTLDRALMLLGLDAVRGIAAAACLDRSVSRSVQTPINPQALALHSVASAFAAEALTKQCGRATPTEAFMAALLHDFGVPVQERVDPAGIAQLLKALAQDPEAEAVVLEAHLVQVGHSRCAEVVFENWRLPQPIVLAAKHHDDPAAAPESARDLASLVYLGVQLALEAGFTHPLEPRMQRQSRESLLRALSLDEASVAAVVEGLAERVLLLVESD